MTESVPAGPVGQTASTLRQGGGPLPPAGRMLDGVARAGCILLALVGLYALLWAPLLWTRTSTVARAGAVLALLAAGVGVWLVSRSARAAASVDRFARHLSPVRVFLLALGVRLGWVVLFGIDQITPAELLARDVWHGRCVLDPKTATGAPWFFALHYAVLGPQRLYPTISIAVLSAVQTLLVFSVTRRITASHTAGALAALFLALWPESVFYTNRLSADTLFSVVVLLAIWCVALGRERGPRRSAALIAAAGLLMGASVWLDGVGLIFLAVAGGFLLLDPGRWVRRARNAACLFAGASALIAPVMVLNARLVGWPSPAPAQTFWWNLLLGTNIEGRGRYDSNPDIDRVGKELARRSARPGEHAAVARERVARELVRLRFRENAAAVVCFALTRKSPYLWGGQGYLKWSIPKTRPYYIPAVAVAKSYHMLMLLLCGVAVLRNPHPPMGRWSGLTPYVFAALAVTLARCFLIVAPHMHHMFLPLVAMLAACVFPGRSAHGGTAPG